MFSSLLVSFLFSFVCVLLFVAAAVVVVIIVIVVMFFTYLLFIQVVHRRQWRTLLLSFLHPFAMILKSCDRNSAKSYIGFIRSKRGTVQF